MTEEERRRQRDSRLRDDRKIVASEIRKVYFSAGIEVRKKLMAKHRECDGLWRYYSEAKLDEAKIRVAEANTAIEKARSLKPWWIFWACIFAVVFIYIGYEIFGQWGAIASAVIAIFFGRYLEHAANHGREANMKASLEAQEEVKAELKELTEEAPRPPLFSEKEAETGEVDELFEDRLRQYGHIS